MYGVKLFTAFEAYGVAAIVAASGGALAGYVATGSVKGAAVGALSGAAFYGIGQTFSASSGFFQSGGIGHYSAHAVTGGIISELEGGKFGHGFWSAGLTKVTNVNGMVGTQQGTGWDVVRVVVAATIGGTISKLTGGKFANGALAAGFAQMFNGNTVTDNRKKGVDLEKLTLKELKKLGLDVVEQVSIDVFDKNGGVTRVVTDYVAVDGKRIIFGEVKAGMHSRLSKNQLALVTNLIQEGATIRFVNQV